MLGAVRQQVNLLRGLYSDGERPPSCREDAATMPSEVNIELEFCYIVSLGQVHAACVMAFESGNIRSACNVRSGSV